MFRKIYLLLIAFTIIFCSCVFDKTDNREIYVLNNSKKVIYSILSENDTMNSSEDYYEYKDDYKKTINKNSDSHFVFQEITCGTKLPNQDAPRHWNKYFKQLPDSKARLFIVHKDSVDKYGWKRIFKKNIYNKKYYLTIQDLDKSNWEIVYDGQ